MKMFSRIKCFFLRKLSFFEFAYRENDEAKKHELDTVYLEKQTFIYLKLLKRK